MINISPDLPFKIFNFVLKTLKFEWQCSQYLALNPTCVLVHISTSNHLLPVADQNFLNFMQLFGKSRQICILEPPTGGSAPPPRMILDPLLDAHWSPLSTLFRTPFCAACQLLKHVLFLETIVKSISPIGE